MSGSYRLLLVPFAFAAILLLSIPVWIYIGYGLARRKLSTGREHL